MTTAADLVREHRGVLLDFDGPICAVFSGISNRQAAERLAKATGVELPEELSASSDPFDVLQYAATVSTEMAEDAERHFTTIELDAVRTAEPTAAAADVITHYAAAGHLVAVVSNNSSAAVEAFLTQRELREHVAGVFGRESADLTLLKPSPYPLHRAVEALGITPDECVFVGDSVSDVVAAHAAGMTAIAYANKPQKVARLGAVHPAATITAMSQIL